MNWEGSFFLSESQRHDEDITIKTDNSPPEDNITQLLTNNNNNNNTLRLSSHKKNTNTDTCSSPLTSILFNIVFHPHQYIQSHYFDNNSTFTKTTNNTSTSITTTSSTATSNNNNNNNNNIDNNNINYNSNSSNSSSYSHYIYSSIKEGLLTNKYLTNINNNNHYNSNMSSSPLSTSSASIDDEIENTEGEGDHSHCIDNNNNNSNSHNSRSSSHHNENNHIVSSSPPKHANNNKDRPINLPNQSSPIKHFALDIGGTLAKLVVLMIVLIFIIENKLHLEDGKPKMVRVTGGGAYKYADLFEQKLGCTLVKEDEMHCLIRGTNFLLNNIHRESYTYSGQINQPNPKEFVDKVENPYPYLLVQIGSGVSVIRVDSETSFQRVDGTSLGGGTFWGLCSLLTGTTDFDEMLEMTKNGHSNNVDLVVGDIYGTDYSKVGLSSDTIASSFGKIIYQQEGQMQQEAKYSREDIAQSLLKMVSNNIGQIAYLNSQRYGLNKIYFGGFFIRDHPNTMQRISFAIDFWSKGKTKAMFLVHDGYLGALGAFLGPSEEKNNEAEPEHESWLKRTTRELQRLFTTSKPEVVITNQKQGDNNNNTPTTSTTTNTTNNNNTSSSRTSIRSSNHSDGLEFDDMPCSCGGEFCEGLVCKVVVPPLSTHPIQVLK
ncbi:pantothenate kinase [Cavenderia fasciculata]|uniref:pantothenate kinase n=1 Tax=Cavenderia fasciculata TaxID=261658 RepID=F4QDA8_CACFS|nr:pantothenate kinase [Cavenderia fasciculata]EGG13736.1 pantothenate kinase [Cavenderia fasciculata]|eukprot:XP_004350440.1 pantothenate kinase [Cavenderia fasciculata]